MSIAAKGPFHPGAAADRRARACRARSGGRPEAAAAHLRPVLERIERTPAIYRGTLYLEAAYHDAVHGMDAARARAWLERARGAPVERQLRLRAEAAVLLAEGDVPAALQCIARAEQALATSIEAGMVLAHADELCALRRSAQGYGRGSP